VAGRPVPGPATPDPAHAHSPAPDPAAVLPAVPPADLVELGVVHGAFGVRGWAHIEPHSPEAEVLRGTRRWWLLREGSPALAVNITGVRVHGTGLVAKWEGCDTPEGVQARHRARISVSRADFPPIPAGEHYWVDLVGLRVVNRSGVLLGEVTGLRNNGAHDILEIGSAQGAELLIPVVGPHIDAIDAAAREVRVDWEADW
jgi:16S rRNA processing protein RimM